jgi:hypothetical protein
MPDELPSEIAEIWFQYNNEWPPIEKIDYREAVKALDWPEYLKLDDPWIRRAIGIVCACKARSSNQLNIGFFGGVAFKLHCPSCNDPHSCFYRTPNDIDIATIFEQGRNVLQCLMDMKDSYGSWFTHFEIRKDRNFNRMRKGKRYLLRALHPGWNEEKYFCKVDLVTNELEFCHKIPLSDVILARIDPVSTIGIANLFLSKAQYIQNVSIGQDPPQDRILVSFGKSEVLIGMEDKDLRDISALLYDHAVGDGPDALSLSDLTCTLKADWGLCETVSLNLRNIIARPNRLEKMGLRSDIIQRVLERADEILSTVRQDVIHGERPAWKSLFNKQWWESVEDFNL